MSPRTNEQLRKAVRERYGSIARGETVGCCEASSTPRGKPSCCTSASASPTLALGYTDRELAELPAGADLGLGCGNPGAIGALKPGEVVLDLGSGGGIDCFLAARHVGESGRVIGVDMTPDMIERARNNARSVGASNVEFRLGEIENVPAADDSVDVVISNCVINLSADKKRVFREAFRVLRPGGRLAVSDIVAKTDIPAPLRDDLAAYTGCIAGAATRVEIENWLREAGFVDVRVTPKQHEVLPADEGRPVALDYVCSASIEGTKPR